MEPSYIVGGIKNCVATLENNLAVFKMLNIVLQYDPEISLLGIYTREMKIYVPAKTCTRMFIAALFITAKNVNNTNAYQLMNG